MGKINILVQFDLYLNSTIIFCDAWLYGYCPLICKKKLTEMQGSSDASAPTSW
jgi:hypothetical protein